MKTDSVHVKVVMTGPGDDWQKMIVVVAGGLAALTAGLAAQALPGIRRGRLVLTRASSSGCHFELYSLNIPH